MNTKTQPQLSFPATDALLRQLHQAYATLVSQQPSVGNDDSQFTELKQLILAVGKAVNVNALSPRSTNEERRQIEAEMETEIGPRKGASRN